MFSNYLLIALQGLKKQPGLSAIKILSLTLGLACSILVIMHVQYAYSFDKHFADWPHIYRLVTSLKTDQQLDTVMSSDAYAPQLKLDYPQIKYITRTRQQGALFSRNGKSSQNAFTYVEPDFLKIFGFTFVSGNAETALNEPNAVVLTETTAKKYFPGENALGQTLTMDDKTELKVTGIIRDIPGNSSFTVDMLIPVATGRQLYGENFMGGNAWVGFGGTITYLTIPDPADAATISSDLPKFVQRNLPTQQKGFANQNELALYLEPLADIYLSPRQGFGQSTNPRAQVLAGLSIFAVLILLTSCINFANLSLSQTQQRGKEIGVRKTLGAKRGQIVWQFLIESLLLTLVALLLALPLVWYAIPVYTALTSTGFTLATALHAGSVTMLLAFVVATGLLSGLLPAFALSRFEPASIIKGVGGSSSMSRWLRSLVTVVQFGFATSLIMLALAIHLQIDYLNTMDIGFNKKNLIVLDTTFNPRDPKLFNYDALIDELKAQPGVLSVAKSSNPPPSTGSYNPWRRPTFAPTEFRTASHIVVDDDYLETMQIKLLAGRGFNKQFATDFIPTLPPAPGQTPPAADDPNSTRSVVITRYAVKNFGFESPEKALDQILLLGGPIQYRIIGVVEDFHLSGGLEDPLRATSLMRATRDPLRVLLIRIDPAQAKSAVEHIDAVWARHRPEVPVSRSFYDQTFNTLVLAQTNGISKAAIFASLITVLISAFGLYALAFYSSLRRTKEVGIRKVLGATSKSVIGLLTWDFVKPVLVACLCSWVAGYFAIHYYFQQFSARVDISPLLYLAVTAGTLLVAVITVSFQCYKAAVSDPVLSLRYE